MDEEATGRDLLRTSGSSRHDHCHPEPRRRRGTSQSRCESLSRPTAPHARTTCLWRKQPELPRGPSPSRSSQISGLRHCYFNILSARGWCRNNQTGFTHRFDVKFNGLPNKLQNLAPRFRHRDAPWKIRNISPVTVCFSLDNNRVTRHSVFSPACFRILFRVPRGMSTFGWPATVTSPILRGCLNCRRLPRVRARYHPSRSMSLIASRTFIV
jgi:hypothetical protein